jgi:hypothetical protein
MKIHLPQREQFRALGRKSWYWDSRHGGRAAKSIPTDAKNQPHHSALVRIFLPPFNYRRRL